jgi:hypothetical protein
MDHRYPLLGHNRCHSTPTSRFPQIGALAPESILKGELSY